MFCVVRCGDKQFLGICGAVTTPDLGHVKLGLVKLSYDRLVHILQHFRLCYNLT